MTGATDFAAAFSRPLVRRTAWVGALVFCILSLVRTAGNPKAQWDFEINYHASVAHARGLNPYDDADLAKVTGRVELPYVYPPYELYYVKPFTWLPFGLATKAFLAAKILMLMAIFAIWVSIFEFSDKLLLFCFAVLAFNGAIFTDLVVGNISTFEQFFIWIGLYCYYKDKPAGAAIGLAIGASVKLVPGVLLVLLLMDGRKSYRKWFAIACASLIILQIVSYLISPELYRAFLHNAGHLDERGSINPSSLALIRTAFNMLGHLTTITIPGGVPLVVYGVGAAGILLVARRVAEFNAVDPNRARQNICLAALTYGVLMPRFKDYSYILVIAPALFTILGIASWNLRASLVVLAMLPVSLYQGRVSPVVDRVFVITNGYYQYWILLVIWCFYCFGRAGERGILDVPDAAEAG